MKKRIIGATILVISLVISFAIMNVSATGSVQRTATINLSSSTGKAGDQLGVDVIIDTTANIYAWNYSIQYDANVFEVDTEVMVDPPFISNYVNPEWDDYYSSTLKNWQKWPTLEYNTDSNLILVSAMASKGITASTSKNNMQIGGFYIKVKAGAPAGPTTITLINTKTADDGDSFGTAMIVTPVTFTVESSVDLVTAPVVNSLGAQIRTTGIQGLRFGTKLTKNDFFKGIGLSGSDKNGKAVTDIQFGTLILPTAYLGEAELTIDGTYAKTVANVLGSNIYEETPTYIVFTAVLTGIPEAQKDTSFTARAYVKYKLDGVDQIVYFEPIARTVNGVTDAAMQ